MRKRTKRQSYKNIFCPKKTNFVITFLCGTFLKINSDLIMVYENEWYLTPPSIHYLGLLGFKPRNIWLWKQLDKICDYHANGSPRNHNITSFWTFVQESFPFLFPMFCPPALQNLIVTSLPLTNSSGWRALQSLFSPSLFW